MAEQPILELKNVYSSYGSIKALKGISLKVYPGEIVAIIGANGALHIDGPFATTAGPREFLYFPDGGQAPVITVYHGNEHRCQLLELPVVAGGA